MNRKKFRNRCFIMALICLIVWAGFSFAEGQLDTSAASIETIATRQETVETEAQTEEVKELNADGDPEINIWDGIKTIAKSTAFAGGTWREYVMIAR